MVNYAFSSPPPHLLFSFFVNVDIYQCTIDNIWDMYD